jgi:hypothetical protein
MEQNRPSLFFSCFIKKTILFQDFSPLHAHTGEWENAPEPTLVYD